MEALGGAAGLQSLLVALVLGQKPLWESLYYVVALVSVAWLLRLCNDEVMPRVLGTRSKPDPGRQATITVPSSQGVLFERLCQVLIERFGASDLSVAYCNRRPAAQQCVDFLVPVLRLRRFQSQIRWKEGQSVIHVECAPVAASGQGVQQQHQHQHYHYPYYHESPSLGSESSTFEPHSVITLSGPRRSLLVEFLEFCDAEYVRMHSASRLISQFVWQGGCWRQRTSSPLRKTMGNLFLPKSTRQKLQDFVQSLEARLDLRTQAGLPTKLGILAHGPPGCGKTALAFALADYMHLDVYHFPMEEFGKIQDAVASLERSCVLLLDEADACPALLPRRQQETGSASRSRREPYDSDLSHPAAAGASDKALYWFLRLLDGFDLPPGCLVVMTTNFIERLDPALYRPGRIDLVLEMSFCDQQQMEEIFEYFFHRPIDWRATGGHVPRRLTPARLINEIVLPHYANPDSDDTIYKLIRDSE